MLTLGNKLVLFGDKTIVLDVSLVVIRLQVFFLLRHFVDARSLLLDSLSHLLQRNLVSLNRLLLD